MTRHPVTAVAALATALCLLVALTASGAIVGPASAAEAGTASDAVDDGTDRTGDAVTPPTRCFSGDGYPISIGETGATIDAIVHLSVVTDPATGNEFGIEAAGMLDDDAIVTLAAGVRLTARQAVANGLNPFAAFELLYAYELNLPMFGDAIGDSEYTDTGPPVETGAGAVPC